MQTAATTTIHFHSSDERCCHSAGPRRFTFDPNEVNCFACKGNDTFVLSEQGAARARVAQSMQICGPSEAVLQREHQADVEERGVDGWGP